MKIFESSMPGIFHITPQVFIDERGYFFEAFHAKKFQDVVGNITFCQDNQSFSKKGVLRGLHFQKPPHEQGKLVRVLSGKVLDIAVDIRPESAHFGQYFKCILDAGEGNMLYVPGGFAHGFLALSDVEFFYKCTNFYNKESEGGILWNDEELNIDWELEQHGFEYPYLSEKDLNLKSFGELKKAFQINY